MQVYLHSGFFFISIGCDFSKTTLCENEKNCDIIIKNYNSNKWVKEVLPLKRLSKEVLKAILTCNVLKYERPCSR